ncbi:MAG: FAD-binding protein [Rhodospirillaceae bacterium]|nr:FAD-binding protein [Rhodospirillaceae bacterium]MBT5455260.1 FAD-binding protein [Rhodospirillaceae bacterium]
MRHLETDVLVAGGGAAGMFAAFSAAQNGARVLLMDKNVVGRGGATIMAQMTCASALGEEEPDGPDQHLIDTLEAGRGLCNENLSSLLCENSPKRIRQLEEWKVQWARQDNGKIRQVMAPGHSRKRCVYVDFLKTGAAISAALRNKISRDGAIQRLSNVTLTDLVTHEGDIIGATGFDISTATPVTIEASAVILCLGGMTKMFRRTTAPNNIAGEGLGLALRAGAKIIDLEFLQFYPNGHMAPRMVGLDPTTWEPTRVKLGGRLLNGNGEEFLQNYGEGSGEQYNTTRDTLTHAMYKEVELGRGSPHGGVFLSFQHIDHNELEKALGPFLELFHRNNIDLTKQPVEVYPIAHYQMGGVEVNTDMETGVPGLYAAGEIAGGANGANRLSGNALPEAMVFGERAGEAAARYVAGLSKGAWNKASAAPHMELIESVIGQNAGDGPSPAGMIGDLKELMWTKVGMFRNGSDLNDALASIRTLRQTDLQNLAVSADTIHNTSVVEWFELRNGLLAMEALAVAALNRRESRGAHQRDDFPETLDSYHRSQRLWLENDALVSSFAE